MRKYYNSLFKLYKKNLKKLNNISFNSQICSLTSLRLYLQYLRDYYILVENTPLNHLPLLALCEAIKEAGEYNNCILKYYTVANGVIESIDKTKTKEEVQKAFQREKLEHWTLFWEIIKTYMESWTANDLKI